eukprot:GEMP01076651.1.p1 GENE.GEMP01076651.1~~GEMP01076651.1.p1  ORF type:complete len:171 (+),score=45.42 GEMP01076651.1:55-567(+)
MGFSRVETGEGEARMLLFCFNCGDVDSIYCVAFQYETGRGVAVDHVEAQRWYMRGAEQNHVPSMAALGRLCEKTGDDTEAVRWYARGAELGNVECQSALGCFYEEGRHVEEDQQQASEWHLKAAEGGSALSMYCLATMAAEGRAEIRDGRAWMEKSAQLGFGPAKEALSE